MFVDERRIIFVEAETFDVSGVESLGFFIKGWVE